MRICIAEANILYLETPIGVGFSYATNISSYGTVNDKITGMVRQFDYSIYWSTSKSYLFYRKFLVEALPKKIDKRLNVITSKVTQFFYQY